MRENIYISMPHVKRETGWKKNEILIQENEVSEQRRGCSWYENVIIGKPGALRFSELSLWPNLIWYITISDFCRAHSSDCHINIICLRIQITICPHPVKNLRIKIIRIWPWRNQRNTETCHTRGCEADGLSVRYTPGSSLSGPWALLASFNSTDGD